MVVGGVNEGDNSYPIFYPQSCRLLIRQDSNLFENNTHFPISPFLVVH